MNPKAHSVARSIARHYLIDAFDFRERFDILLPHDLTRTGRVKRFVDLFMGCECALKTRIFLSSANLTADQIYKKVRKSGHDIGKLYDLACLTPDRENYDHLKSELQPFSVFLRYSLDANNTIFPILENWDVAQINYQATIGNSDWMKEIRKHLSLIMDDLSQELGGWTDCDPAEIFVHAEEIRAILQPKKSST